MFDGRLRIDGVTTAPCDRGEHRHRSLAPTLDELADQWLEQLETRGSGYATTSGREQATAKLVEGGFGA